MEFNFEFKVDHLNRALAAARDAISHPKEMLLFVGSSLVVENRRRHESGLAPDGTPWKPLAPSTIGNDIWNKQKKANRKGNSKRGAFHDLKVAREVQANRRILMKTGHMLNSIDRQVHGDTLSIYFDGTREEKLANIHHSGTDPYTISPKKAKALSFGGIAVKRVHHPGLPARPLIGFPESDQRVALEEVDDYLTIILQRARGQS